MGVSYCAVPPFVMRWAVWERALAYGDLKIHHLFGVGAHLIVEAELVFARFFRRKDGIDLSLLVVVHYDIAAGALDAVVDVE